MVWKKLVIAVLFFSFFSCIRFYHHPKGGFRPKKPKFTLKPNNFKLNDKIDTLSIYINTDTLYYGKYSSVFFLKFYNNGCLFYSSIDTKEKLNSRNLKPGDIGYYNLNKKNIEIEYYIVNPNNSYHTEYVKLNGIIKGDSLIFNNRFIKGDKDIYIKQKIDFTPEPSNW